MRGTIAIDRAIRQQRIYQIGFIALNKQHIRDKGEEPPDDRLRVI
jgi:hypothetical protein